MSRNALYHMGRLALRWWPIGLISVALAIAPTQVSAEESSADTTVAAATSETVATSDPAADSIDQEALAAGAQVFSQVCAACHQAGGVGLAGKYPPLKDNPNVQDAAYVAKVITEGRSGAIVVNGETYDQQMPPQPSLTDDDIADVIVYIQSGFQAPAAAIVADAGPVAGTSLPALSNLTSIVALLLAAGVGVFVFAPRITSAHEGRRMPWLDAWMKAGIIVVGIIVFTVFVPAKVLESETVSKLSRPAQDIIASGLWVGGLAGGLWALWYAQRDRRI